MKKKYISQIECNSFSKKEKKKFECNSIINSKNPRVLPLNIELAEPQTNKQAFLSIARFSAEKNGRALGVNIRDGEG